ncbi:MAG: GTP-binding protein Der [Candidatus Tokpelaia sp. JSC161]|jgi:GTP-binding protein|nr:MAG: GTP-binding protein Der [Candidatus Tokpelaia sp. JSC161]
MALTVAILGQPNVGKSTLFNRLVGKKIAIVDDTPGATRDRRIHPAHLQDLSFDLVDTAGLQQEKSNIFRERLRVQTQMAIQQSDLLLFLFDAKIGVTPTDILFMDLLRKSGKPIILVGNKSESKKSNSGFYEAWKLGSGDPCAISAEHGLGLSDLRDALAKAIEKNQVQSYPQKEQKVSTPLHIAIVGRPNVGKSTLVNTMLGEERLLTGPESGITRDAISVDLIWHHRKIKIHDTAGLRRKTRIQEKLEKLSGADTLRAIRFAEVVVLVLDITAAFEKQDLQIADLVIREGRAMVIVFNKSDKVQNDKEQLALLSKKCEHLLPQVRGLRSLEISGKYGKNLDKLMENIEKAHRAWNQRLSTGKLNRWLQKTQMQHLPPAILGRRIKIKYISQTKIRPPFFKISCSQPDAIPQSYLRYLTNKLREDFNLLGTPIRISIIKNRNPFTSAKN